MVKKIIKIVKLNLWAGKATPAPPIGTSLGQHGVNIATFCKEYNTRTIDQIGFIIPAIISIYEDKNYSFILKTCPVSILLFKNAQIKKGSAESNKKIIATIDQLQLKEIAKIKLPDLNTELVETAIKIIKGTAKNMGISVKLD